MKITEIIFEQFKIELQKHFEEKQVTELIQLVEEKMNYRCGHVMTRGKRIGESCNRKCPGKMFCKSHSLNYSEFYLNMQAMGVKYQYTL